MTNFQPTYTPRIVGSEQLGRARCWTGGPCTTRLPRPDQEDRRE
jgi:hypothetical protein